MQESSTPTIDKAIWDLVEVFYVDKNAPSWLPERLVDWLAVSYYECPTLSSSSILFWKQTSSFFYLVKISNSSICFLLFLILLNAMQECT